VSLAPRPIREGDGLGAESPLAKLIMGDTCHVVHGSSSDTITEFTVAQTAPVVMPVQHVTVTAIGLPSSLTLKVEPQRIPGL